MGNRSLPLANATDKSGHVETAPIYPDGIIPASTGEPVSQPPFESSLPLQPEPCPSVNAICDLMSEGATPSTRWVLEHAHHCDDCRQLLSASAMTETDDSPASNSYTLAVEDTVASRYRILRRIGHGGMGEVYEALDTELDERVALKTLTLTRLDSASAINRFKQEIKLARRVTHASVCKLFEFGFHNRATPRGTEVIPFITMEFIEGQSLNEAMHERSAFKMADAKMLLLQLLEGLAALHDTGVVHRDLKPHNVLLVSKQEDPLRVVLIDFGLARIMNARPGSLSGANVFAGSFEYASPEQLRGENVTAKSDLYSLGVVAFEILTGHRPFSGTDSLAEATQRLTEAPKRLEDFGVISREWQDFIARCLERSPDDRFVSARAAAAAVSALPSRETDKRLMVWPRLALAALACATLAGSAAFATVFTRAPGVVRSLSPTPNGSKPSLPAQNAAAPSEARVDGEPVVVNTDPPPMAVTASTKTPVVQFVKRSRRKRTTGFVSPRTSASASQANPPAKASLQPYRAWQAPETSMLRSNDGLVSPYHPH